MTRASKKIIVDFAINRFFPRTEPFQAIGFLWRIDLFISNMAIILLGISKHLWINGWLWKGDKADSAVRKNWSWRVKIPVNGCKCDVTVPKENIWSGLLMISTISEEHELSFWNICGKWSNILLHFLEDVTTHMLKTEKKQLPSIGKDKHKFFICMKSPEMSKCPPNMAVSAHWRMGQEYK